MSHFTVTSLNSPRYSQMTPSLKFRKYRYLIFTTLVTVFLQTCSPAGQFSRQTAAA